MLQEFPRICEPVFERTYPEIVGLLISQSLQSARLFLQSSEMGLPQPLTRKIFDQKGYFCSIRSGEREDKRFLFLKPYS